MTTNYHEEPRKETALQGETSGVASVEEIEQRAREIAETDGRLPEQVTEEDRERARIELRSLTPGSDERAVSAPEAEASRNPGEPMAISGQAAPETKAYDPERLEEELIQEGVDEAYHERSVAAHREGETSPEKRPE